jgi:hypothetical protein
MRQALAALAVALAMVARLCAGYGPAHATMATKPNTPATAPVATVPATAPAPAPAPAAPAAGTLPPPAAPNGTRAAPWPCPGSKGRATPVLCIVGTVHYVSVPMPGGTPAVLPFVVPPALAGGAPAGTTRTVHLGAPALWWLGANGTPLQLHVVACPAGAVAVRMVAGKLLANPYPLGYGGGHVTATVQP